MNRRFFLKSAASCAAAVSISSAGVFAAALDGPKRPNILIILSDDHSAPHLGCYGNKDIKTPNMDAFAAEGMRFDRAYVTCPQCVPSRASIMTGRAPVDINMSRFSAPLPEHIPVFPQLLRQDGYFAGVAGRTYHLDGPVKMPDATRTVFDKYKLETFKRRLDYVNTLGNPEKVLGQFREFLDMKPQEKPFVLQLCFSDPHRPHTANKVHDPGTLSLPGHFPDTAAIRRELANYYDELARLDESFGAVMAELDKRGLKDTTIVMFMGDNGASQLRGKGTLYEFGIHVPLLVRWPGVVKAGSSANALISGEDIAPTILEAGGVKPIKDMTGRSFLPLLKGQTYNPRDYIFAERGAHGSSLPMSTAAFDLGRVVVGKRYKFIYTVLWQLPYEPVDFETSDWWKELGEMNRAGKLSEMFSKIYFPPKRPMFELYDLQNDPFELTNLAGKAEFENIEYELKSAMQEWMILQRDYLPLPIAPKP